MEAVSNTYDFLVVMLETSDHEEHLLLIERGSATSLLNHLQVSWVLLVRSTLQIEGVVTVHNLQQTLEVFWWTWHIQLLLERLCIVVGEEAEVVASSGDDHWLLSLESLLCQVATLIVKQSVTVTTPGNALHQDSKHVKQS